MSKNNVDQYLMMGQRIKTFLTTSGDSEVYEEDFEYKVADFHTQNDYYSESSQYLP